MFETYMLASIKASLMHVCKTLLTVQNELNVQFGHKMIANAYCYGHFVSMLYNDLFYLKLLGL